MRQHPALTVAQAPALTGKRLTPSLAMKYILNGLPFTAIFSVLYATRTLAVNARTPPQHHIPCAVLLPARQRGNAAGGGRGMMTMANQKMIKYIRAMTTAGVTLTCVFAFLV